MQGFFILRKAIDADHLKQINAQLDDIVQLDPPLKHGEWYGCVQAHTYGGADGINLQQIYEAGEPFERLIDHPSWYQKVFEMVGADGTFDVHHGPMFIDENFASLRGPGEAIGLHSGGHSGCMRGQFNYRNGRFHSCQVNALMAFSDIGPGDGATMVIPGSHKANFPHYEQAKHQMQETVSSVDGMEEAIEVHLEAGDVLLFVDSIAHGSAKRVNDGLRRIAVYRYGPSWGFFRHPYRPSQAMLDRLTDRQRAIVMPHGVIPRTPNRLADTPNPPGA